MSLYRYPAGVRFPALLSALLLLLMTGACMPGADAAGQPTPPTAEVILSPTLPPTPTATQPAPTLSPSPQPTATLFPTETPFPGRVYLAQPGDTLQTVAARFGVQITDLECVDVNSNCPTEAEENLAYPETLLAPGTPILLAPDLADPGPFERLLPDSELVFSVAASGFDVAEFVLAADGSLARHRQYLMMNAWNTGAGIVTLVAYENSVNPRLLLALLEHQCRCVLAESETLEPYMGAGFYNRHDLYGQLVWAVHELSNGYYGWRAGTLTEVTLRDGTRVRLHPELNAGTASLYNFFAALYGQEGFDKALDPKDGVMATYREMFGDPWEREVSLYPEQTRQPALALPFAEGLIWSFTGGPHPAFEGNGPRAALDFAPASAEPGCQPTPAWVTAVADGPVVTSEFGMVIQDLDGDGDPHTGWTILYLHVGAEDRVPVGTILQTGDRVGKPSCEGGTANGTHLHIARRLNGEWIAAGSGPLPFILNGWVAQDGPEVYKGTLTREETTLVACTCSWRQSWIENE